MMWWILLLYSFWKQILHVHIRQMASVWHHSIFFSFFFAHTFYLKFKIHIYTFPVVKKLTEDRCKVRKAYRMNLTRTCGIFKKVKYHGATLGDSNKLQTKLIKIKTCKVKTCHIVTFLSPNFKCHVVIPVFFPQVCNLQRWNIFRDCESLLPLPLPESGLQNPELLNYSTVVSTLTQFVLAQIRAPRPFMAYWLNFFFFFYLFLKHKKII